jgi:hypothetical protein
MSGPSVGCPIFCVFCMGCPMGFFGLGHTICRRWSGKIRGISHCPILNVGPLAPVAQEKRIFASISGWIGLGQDDS